MVIAAHKGIALDGAQPLDQRDMGAKKAPISLDMGQRRPGLLVVVPIQSCDCRNPPPYPWAGWQQVSVAVLRLHS